MLYDENDAPALKAWIVKLLESPSRSDGDVDADVLADYVLALLRHEGSRAEVRKLCEDELYDFLKDETVPFVREVFSALDSKEAQPAPAPVPPSKKRAYHESSLPGDDANHWQQQINGGPAAKQARHDSGLPYSDNDAALRMQQQMANMFAPLPGVVAAGASSGTTGGGGGKGRGDSSRRMCRYFEKKGFCTRPDCKFAHGPATPTPTADALPVPAGMPPGMPAAFPGGGYDYGYGGYGPGDMSLPAMDPEAMGAAGFPFHPMMMFNPAAAAAYFMPQAQQQPSSSSSASAAPRRKGAFRPPQRASISAEGPVRDQSQTKLVVEGIPDEYLDEEEVQSFFQTFGPVQRVTLQPARRLAVVEFASWKAANAAYKSPKAVFDNRFVKVYWHKEPGGGGEHEGVGGKNKKKKKKKKKKQTTGTVGVGVVAASEENGGDNGDKNDDGDGGGHGDADDDAGDGDDDDDGDDADADNDDDGDGDDDDDDDTPAFDMEAFLQKQQVAQALHEEKRRKWEAVERQRQVLEARQKALLAKQQEERQRLMAKMASVAARVKRKQEEKRQQKQPNHSDTETPDGSASSHGGGRATTTTTMTTTTTPTASAQTEMIRAQLAALEEEAKLLGLDPDALGPYAYNNSSSSSSSSSLIHGGGWASSSRGRGGRGGGGYARGLLYRGGGGGVRGGGYRGSLRGGGLGSLPSRYAAYSLDNRPRRVVVRGAVDLAAPAQNEALRQYLMGVGAYEAIETGADGTVISFADRRTAEAFFYGLQPATAPPAPTGADGATAWKSIPGVDGAVTVDWVAGNAGGGGGGGTSGTSSSGAAQSKDAATSFVLDIDSEDEEDDHDHHDEKGGAADGHETQQQQQQRAQNVDFDVGDEDWDMQ